MSNSQHSPTVTQALSQASGDDALSTNSTEPDFGPATAAGELGRLAGYRIQKQLGKGGMGAVYLAFDESLRRQVALKVMLPKFAADPLAKERFLREARAAAAVRNDHVVTIFQVGEDRGIPFIAMDYLLGHPLDAFLKRSGKLTIPQAMRVGLEVATGLAAAHALGMVHRDIKPANLWLEAPQGRIKILDFGLARQTDGNSLAAEITAQGAIVGTPAFMSPEQARGEAVDHRTDLFSLGCVLYHLVAGKLPFERPTVMAMMIALATEDPPPVQSLNPDVPPAFSSLIHQLLAKKPDHRPASATDVANTLRALEYQLANPNAAHAPAAQPQVVYVPIQMNAHEQHNLDAFANLDAATATSVKQTELSDTDVEPEETPLPAKSRGGIPMWAVALALLLAGGAVAGVFAMMKKPTDVTKEQPLEPTPPPKVDPGPKPPTYPVLEPAEANRRLALWVIAQGGWVELDDGTIIPDPANFPADLRKISGLYIPKTVKHHVTDDDLDLLKNTTIRRLSFGATSDITDKGLEKLSQSGLEKQLTLLGLLDAPKLTDAGMPFIGKFRSLTLLGLHSPKITDAGLGHLNNLQNLALLELNGTGITDERLVPELGGLPKLANLDVKNTKVTIPGVKKLLLAKPGLQVTMDYDQTADPDYKLATWVIAKSPAATVNLGAKGVIKKAELLPKDVFTLFAINMGNYTTTDADVDRFRDTTATNFTLNTTAITDKGWMKWSKFPDVGRIELLRIAGPAVNDNAAYHLIAFQGLQTLEFRDAEITDVTLRRLALLPALKTLILRNTKVTADGVKALKAKKPELQIDYYDPGTDPERRVAEWVCLNKGMLGIRWGENSIGVFSTLDRLPKGPIFEIVSIKPSAAASGVTISDANVEVLLPLQFLTTLQPKFCTLTDEGVKKLATATFAPKLTSLAIHSPNLTNAGLEHLRHFPELTFLVLQDTQITEEGLKHLSALKKLQNLSLKGTKVTLKGAKTLMAAIPDLKVEMDSDPKADPDRKLAEWVIGGGGQIFVGGTVVSDVKKLPSGPLVVKSAVVNILVDLDVPRFRDTFDLRIMNYSGKPQENQLTDKGLAEWATYPSAAKLMILSLGSPKVTDEGIAHLKKFTSLNTLDLRHTGLTDVGLKKLAEMKSLQTLDVKHTKITAEGAKAFREALPSCKLLTDFDKP